MSSRADALRPPSGGMAPRDTARLPDGSTCFLAPLAHTVAQRHLAEFPDEAERYGPAGFEWCVHDVQWILSWATSELETGDPVLGRQLAWLDGVLRARGYPTERLGRAVELAAAAVDEAHGVSGRPLADVLRSGASVGRAQ